MGDSQWRLPPRQRRVDVRQGLELLCPLARQNGRTQASVHFNLLPAAAVGEGGRVAVAFVTALSSLYVYAVQSCTWCGKVFILNACFLASGIRQTITPVNSFIIISR